MAEQMETESELTLRDKCELLMNKVVESRKVFGKKCVSYEEKSHLVSNKILRLQIDTVNNYKFKPKNPLPDLNYGDMCRETDEFMQEILIKEQNIVDLKLQLRNTRAIVEQLRNDTEYKEILNNPIDPQTLLERAKKNLNLKTEKA